MAKPITELLTELQAAVDTADTAREAALAANAAYQARTEKAKAAFDAEESSAKADVVAAQTAFTEAATYVETLQAEVNKVLGIFSAKSRVTISR